MRLSSNDIKNLSKVKRLNLINGVTGIKSANLIGTVSRDGVTNVSIFSSVTHLGSDPALLGFVLRPTKEARRDTYTNILETEEYTINHVFRSATQRAHYTSAKFAASESEFELCGLKEQFIPGFKAPFVRDSKIKMGMRFIEILDIKRNSTRLIVGEIQHLILPDKVIDAGGLVNLEIAESVGVGGLNSYYALEHLASYPYAKTDELPNF